MQPARFDQVAQFFASRRISRRRALAESGVGIAAGIFATNAPTAGAQDATPTAPSDSANHQEMLFLQSFQSGTIAAKEGDASRYTLTLEQGLGQTIFFSERPERVVGASPTPQFLDGLGFFDHNPPNAALIVETGVNESEIAVIELFNPLYDEASHTATYEAEVLANWQKSTELEFTAAPSDLTALAPNFGAAHLFIDGCTTANLRCLHPSGVSWNEVGQIPVTEFNGWCYRAGEQYCLPCTGRETRHDSYFYWGDVCNKRFSDCYDKCRSAEISLPIP